MLAALLACDDNEQGDLIDVQPPERDAETRLDASAQPEAGAQSGDAAPEFIPEQPDAAFQNFDGGGSALDAAVDASASIPDGSVCFGLVSQGDPAVSCPAEACLPAAHVYPVKQGVLTCQNRPCTLSTLPLEPNSSRFMTYGYSDADLDLILSFDERIVTGYSLDAFRRWSMGAGGQVWLTVDGRRTWASIDNAKVEFLSYDSGELHFIVRGEIHRSEKAVDVVPYICQTGHLPTICTSEWCLYQSEATGGSGKPSVLVVEGRLMVAPPGQ